MAETYSKTCRGCGIEKQFAEFSRKREANDGRQTHCKVCRSLSYLSARRHVPPYKSSIPPLLTDKACSKCGVTQPGSEFSPRAGRGRPEYQSQCKSCRNEYGRSTRNRWYASLTPERRRAIWVKASYGITLEQYDEMLAAQSGACKLCGKVQPDTNKRLRIDHCHETGRIRGLLCGPCNSALGTLGDNPEGLQRALDYVSGAIQGES